MRLYEDTILPYPRHVRKAKSCQLMSTKTGLIGLVLLMFAVCGCGPGAVSARWEYRTMTLFNTDYTAAQKIDPSSKTLVQDLRDAKSGSGRFDINESKLNELGSDGWELVACIPEVETIPDAKTYATTDFTTSGKPTERYRDFTNIRVYKATLLFKRRIR